MKQEKNTSPLLAAIVEPLLAWYETHRRPLPWRESPEPYHVWLSEIMLQQTRIEAVIPYYERFLRELPTIETLAAVDDERLMKLWEGLGYYSRARNLKRAALCIVNEHGGSMPDTYEALRALPGIGPYTAGAIASIAFGRPEPAVDGNVLRVITRLTADERDVTKQTTKDDITRQLRDVYPSEPPRAAAMTQAVMELGERVCLPNGAPRCDDCPLGAFCQARQLELTDHIPFRSPKKERRTEDHTVFLIVSDGKIALVKRPEQGLLAGLWEFPSVKAVLDETAAAEYLRARGAQIQKFSEGAQATHIFTHIEWHMQAYLAVCNCPPNDWNGAPLCFVSPCEMQESYAIPTAHRAFVRAILSEWDGIQTGK